MCTAVCIQITARSKYASAVWRYIGSGLNLAHARSSQRDCAKQCTNQSSARWQQSTGRFVSSPFFLIQYLAPSHEDQKVCYLTSIIQGSSNCYLFSLLFN